MTLARLFSLSPALESQTREKDWKIGAYLINIVARIQFSFPSSKILKPATRKENVEKSRFTGIEIASDQYFVSSTLNRGLSTRAMATTILPSSRLAMEFPPS